MRKILDLNHETLDSYKACFVKNGIPKQTEIIKWQFFNNGLKNHVSLEFDENLKTIAAIYATFSVKFKIDDNIVIGSQSLDTITDVDYRGKGLFTKLANDVYQKANNNDVSFVYGFPNGNSIYGFEKKLDWTVLDPVPFLIKPLRSEYFTKRINFLKFLPNVNLTFTKKSKSKKYSTFEKIAFPDSVNILWSSFSKDIKVAVQRDKVYLDWRYLQKPLENYKIAHCYDLNNILKGFIVYSVKEKHEGRIGYIMELIYDLKYPEVSKELLQFAISEINMQKADCILSWCLDHSPNASAYKKEFFIKIPEKFKPIELHFGARCFVNELKGLVNNRKNWYLSYSDSDTV
ncbi:MAG: GNAT family N-acetyltransferase [Flavobacteriaceae bacterium]|nr:GNAT family N-acetyltransferase [Flavobacteriaceae bacterium]